MQARSTLRRSLRGVTMLFAALLAVSPAFAALPPRYQRARELGAVIEHAAGMLPAPIDLVEHMGEALYRVRAGGCVLELRIAHEPRTGEDGRPPVVGPVPFTVVPGQPSCR